MVLFTVDRRGRQQDATTRIPLGELRVLGVPLVPHRAGSELHLSARSKTGHLGVAPEPHFGVLGRHGHRDLVLGQLICPVSEFSGVDPGAWRH